MTAQGLQLITGPTVGEATIVLSAIDPSGFSVISSFLVGTAKPSYTISVRSSPSSYGIVRGAQTSLSGTLIGVRASPHSHCRFRK